MKNLLVVCFFLSTTIAFAQPPAGDAKPGDWYGKEITTAGAINAADLPAKLLGDNTIQTKVKAKVLDVCSAKGCWMKVAINDTIQGFVKMKNYGFFVPLAAKGKTVVIDGDAKIKTTTIEELRHYAEDAKKSKKEIKAITKPEREVRFIASGIVVAE